MHQPKILISGASFAGLATAYWMTRAGYEVTVIEVASALRQGGTPVNIKGDTIGIMQRMGLLDLVQMNRIVTTSVELQGRQGSIQSFPAFPEANESDDGSGGPEYEIERDTLTRLLFERVEADIEIVFDDSVSRLEDNSGGVDVSFRRGQQRSYDLVFGCDGVHSNIRNLCFGQEAAYSHFLNTYGSVTIVPRLIVEQGSLTIYQAPGRLTILNAYHGKTDIVTVFSCNEIIAYNKSSRTQKVAIICDRFAGEGWRIPDFLEDIGREENLYFSALSQIRMPKWTKGRIALVGDAAYCASAAAGMGGSLAINGAAALGDAFANRGNDHASAFRAYDAGFRPFVEKVQAEAVGFCTGVAAGQIA